MTSLPKLKKFLAKKLVESTGILLSALLVFSAIVYASLSTWIPGGSPEAAPGEGNVELPGDSRCDLSGKCFQVCIGNDCRNSWPSGEGDGVAYLPLAGGTLNDSATIDNANRMHIAAAEDIYLLARGGDTYVSDAWGGAGNLKASGTICDKNGCIGDSSSSHVSGGLYGYCYEYDRYTWTGFNMGEECDNESVLAPAFCSSDRCACPTGYILKQFDYKDATKTKKQRHYKFCYKE